MGNALYAVYRVWTAHTARVRIGAAVDGENTFGLPNGTVADEVRDVHGRVV